MPVSVPSFNTTAVINGSTLVSQADEQLNILMSEIKAYAEGSYDTIAAQLTADTQAILDATAELYDSFDDRYLGVRSNDPTLDNDGGALLAGALYFNIVSQELKYFDGSVWKAPMTDAQNSADAADTSASEAEASAVNALASEQAAASSASSALSSLNAVEQIFDSFDDRYLGAKSEDPIVDNDGDPLVAGQIYWNTTTEGLKFYNGATWEDPSAQAATSAANALASEQASATSEANALASEQAADTSEANALASEQAADTSASNASTSEANALASEQASAISASNASTSEANALASEQASAISASDSATSAAQANSSAIGAASSASDAVSSASDSATSAANALASEQASASLLDQFDDRYLGDKATDPLVDNDGDALLTGALYFNTTDNLLKIYTGTVWQDTFKDIKTYDYNLDGIVDGADRVVDLDKHGIKEGGLSVSVDVTDLDLLVVNPGTYYIDGVEYSYAGGTLDTSSLGAGDFGTVGINAAGALILKSNDFFTEDEFGYILELGAFVKYTNTTIDVIADSQFNINKFIKNLLIRSKIFEGTYFNGQAGLISENATPLRLDVEAGYINTPNAETKLINQETAISGATIYHISGTYEIQAQSPLVVSDAQYDNGTDIVPIQPNRYVTHTIARSSRTGTYYLIYGNTQYQSEGDAKQAPYNLGVFANNESTSEVEPLANIVVREASGIVAGGIIDLRRNSSNVVSTVFANLTLQAAYDLSGVPEIQLANGKPFEIRNDLADSNNVLQKWTDSTGASILEVTKTGLSTQGQPNGIATLDGAGKVPASQLPSYVDDVLEYANLASFPTTGESGKIYIDASTDTSYRWTGSTYIDISGAVDSVDGRSGAVTLTDLYEPKNTNIQEHIASTSNPHNVTKSQVGLSNVDNTSDLNKPVSTAQQAALDTKFDKSGGSISGALDINTTGRAITITGDATLDGADASIYLGNTPTNYGYDIKYEGTGSGVTNAFVIESTNAGSPKELLRSNSDGIVNLPQLGAKVAGNTIYHSGNLSKAVIDALNVNADTLDGQHGSYYYPASNPNGYTSNVGDITAVTAGNGLSGGGSSGSVTLNVNGGKGIKVTGDNVYINGAEIPAGADLNTYRSTGIFTQNTNSDAGSGSNYPVSVAGILQVLNDDYGNGLFTSQLYSQYNSQNLWYRTYYNGSWSTWKNLSQDTSYSHPTYAGDDINVDTGALSGATVISDLDFNVTTDTLGHVTDANAVVSTRNITASDIGAAPSSHSHSYLPLAGGTIDGGTNTTVTLLSNDNGVSMLKCHGDAQGTGAIEVGQSSSYGGGMAYNGDGTPAFANGETADRIMFYRLNNGTRTEVFSYGISDNNVIFNGTVTAPTFSGALSGTLIGTVSGNASTATWADTVDVNSGNTSSGWYDVCWHSGDTVYSSTGVEIQGSTNTLRASRLAVGATDEYFYSDSTGRIATSADFYVQSGSTNTYLYSSNVYLGGSSGTSIYARGNTMSGNSWSITGAGAITGSSLTLGAGATIQESTDRADLLQVTSSTSTWAGIQLRNSSNEGRWSLMTDGSTFGIYDDENNEWSTQWNENGETKLYFNGAEKFNTHNTGATVTGDLSVTGGDVILGGTGRIQGIDTVSNGTDAANKTYVDNAVANAGGATGGGSDKIFVQNDQVVTTSYTIPSGQNAMSAGDLTINSGVTVTISDGSRWVIV